jgi:hypothetical protein
MTKPCGNILNMFLGLGPYAFSCAKKTLSSCIKIKFATELIKWFLNGRLVKRIVFPIFT